jgi:hypothetical protein
LGVSAALPPSGCSPLRFARCFAPASRRLPSLTQKHFIITTTILAMSYILPSTPGRAAYERFVQHIQKNNKTGENFLIQKKTLVLHAELNANTNQYTFNLRNQGAGPATNPNDVYLAQNDLFFLAGVAIGIQKFVNVAGTRSAQGNYPIFFAPDPNYHIGNTSAESASLETIYNGILNFNTTPVDRVGDLHTGMFRTSPRTPYLVAPTGQDGASNPNFDFAEVVKALDVNPIIDGLQDNRVTLTIGQGTTTNIGGGVTKANAVSTVFNSVVIILDGYIAVNGASKVALVG